MKRLITTCFVLFAVAACSESEQVTAPGDDGNDGNDTQGITIDNLVGSWTASSHMFTNNSDAGETYDLIANGGETRVTVLSGGGARTWFIFGPVDDEWDAQLTLVGSTLTSRPVEASRSVRNWTVTLEGNVLTLTDTDASFDFTLSDAAEVSATEVVVLVRQ
jgi:hypothetical protein